MKKKLILLFSLFISGMYAQDCDNIGFEKGDKSNWTCRQGTYGGTFKSPCTAPTFSVTMTQDQCSAGANDDILSPGDKFANRHTLMTNKTAMDPNTNPANPVSCVAPASLFPNKTNN